MTWEQDNQHRLFNVFKNWWNPVWIQSQQKYLGELSSQNIQRMKKQRLRLRDSSSQINKQTNKQTTVSDENRMFQDDWPEKGVFILHFKTHLISLER